MQNLRLLKTASPLLIAALCNSLAFWPVAAQSVAQAGTAKVTSDSSAHHPSRFPRRAQLTYSLVWGIDDLSVKTAESGELVRFSYRVVNGDRAKLLNDKKLEPSLIDLQAGVKLVIPELEKVGKLRSYNTPEDGKSYWMAFSNRGQRVKRGDRVTVVIGTFRAENLVVD